MQVKVFLKPHTGIQDSDDGPVTYTHPDQWMVYFHTDENTMQRFIGYLGKKSGAPFNPCGHYIDQPTAIQEMINQAVMQELGEQRPVGCTPLHISALEQITDSDDGDN